ncbi:MAG: mechanosensitive ion channel, partial [Proteobacteria bacterium]|nr:mechanosensitive ion channel [Pseudomonadota bacterium]
MTASERIFGTAAAAWRDVSQLTLADLGLNLALTAAIAVAALAAVGVLTRLARAAARRLPGDPTAAKKVLTTRWARLGAMGARIAVTVLAAAGVASVWGLDPWSWTATPQGARLLTVAAHLALLSAAALVGAEAARHLIGHALAHMAAAAADPRRQAQLRTLDPLLRGLAQSAILAIFILMVLSEVGVKVGPLLAGAGVVGIALGFGAQSIVKDLLTGVFLIIEDIVSVGDVVRIGDSGGLVESMTLRTIRLRDFDGTLHVLPYGEAQTVHNLTKT